MTYLIATNNQGKVKEIEPMFAKAGFSLKSLADFRLSFEPQEDGDTFEHNAIQKAQETLAFLQANGHTDIAVIADDSGLCIDGLGGMPGVDSANFMGRETPYELRNAHIIKQLQDTPVKTAKFVCVIACVFPCGKVITTTGEIHGHIATKPEGSGGFGYDPIFYVPEYGKTMANLTVEEKNKISHRGQGLEKMLKELKGWSKV